MASIEIPDGDFLLLGLEATGEVELGRVSDEEIARIHLEQAAKHDELAAAHQWLAAERRHKAAQYAKGR